MFIRIKKILKDATIIVKANQKWICYKILVSSKKMTKIGNKVYFKKMMLIYNFANGSKCKNTTFRL